MKTAHVPHLQCPLLLHILFGCQRVNTDLRKPLKFKKFTPKLKYEVLEETRDVVHAQSTYMQLSSDKNIFF